MHNKLIQFQACSIRAIKHALTKNDITPLKRPRQHHRAPIVNGNVTPDPMPVAEPPLDRQIDILTGTIHNQTVPKNITKSHTISSALVKKFNDY